MPKSGETTSVSVCSVSTLGSGSRDMIYGKQKAGEIDRNYATDKIRPLRRLRIQQAGISSDNYKLCQVVRSPGEDKLNRHLFLHVLPARQATKAFLNEFFMFVRQVSLQKFSSL